MIVEELVSSGSGSKCIVHDDVLTREMVESYRGCSCMLTMSRGIEFVRWKVDRCETHRYPMVAQERIIPLQKLMVQLEIPFSAVPPLPQVPQEWRKIKPTKKQAEAKRAEAKMAAARRVLDYKARQGVDPNDALSLTEERDVDVW